MTITEFLEARIAEDEALAQAAIEDDGGQDGGFEDAYDRLAGRCEGKLAFIPRFGDAAARMIVWNTPRRVLAECEAKRTIIAEHGPSEVASLDRETWGKLFVVCRVCVIGSRQVVAPCPTLRALAAVYTDHQDYRQEWAL
jgi:hypothetical protein